MQHALAVAAEKSGTSKTGEANMNMEKLSLSFRRRINWKILYRSHKLLINAACIVAAITLIIYGIAFSLEHSADLQLKLSSASYDLHVTLAILNGASENESAMYLADVNTIAALTKGE